MRKRNPRKSSKQVSMADAINALLKGETKAKPVKPKQKTTTVQDDFDEWRDLEEDSDDDIRVFPDSEEIEIERSPLELAFEEEDSEEGMSSFIRGSGTDLSIYEDEEDDDDWYRNNPSIFTPLNIGIGVLVLGTAGYFGYKKFTKSDDESNS